MAREDWQQLACKKIQLSPRQSVTDDILETIMFEYGHLGPDWSSTDNMLALDHRIYRRGKKSYIFIYASKAHAICQRGEVLPKRYVS